MILTLPKRGSLPGADLFIEFIAKGHDRSTSSEDYNSKINNDFINSIKPFINKYPTIILLPGGPGGDHSAYAEQVGPLSLLANIIVFDPRGCGASTVSGNQEYHMDVYIDDIEQIRKFFGLENFLLLGTSYGSMAAQGYAVHYNHSSLKGLILVAGASNYTFIDTAKDILARIGSVEQKAMFTKLLNGNLYSDDDMMEYFKVMAPLYSLKSAQPNDKSTKPNDSTESSLIKKGSKYNYEATLAGLGPDGFLHKFDFRDRLSEVKCPVRIVVGDQDWINDKIHAFEAQKLYKDCKVEVIANSGHFLRVDQKDIYLKTVSNFIHGILGQPSAIIK